MDNIFSESVDTEAFTSLEGQQEDYAMDFERHVRQLNQDNYQRWKYDVQTIMKSKGVLKVAQGTEKEPTTDKTAIENWEKKDATAMMILAKSMDDEHHTFIRSCTTAAEIWSTIVKLKEQSSASTLLLTSQEYHSLQWESGMTVSSFISRLNVIAGKLETLKAKPNDQMLIGKVVHCLPPEYESFRQSWRLISTSSSTFSDLQAKLIAAEADLKSRNLLSINEGDAFYNYGGSGSEGNKKSRSTNHGQERRVL